MKTKTRNKNIKRTELVLIGGGGHCLSCLEVIESTGKYKVIGIVDRQEKVGQKVAGYPILGSDADLPKLIKKYKNFLITLGQIKSPELRIKIYQSLKAGKAVLPVIIAPTAYVSADAEIGEGTIIMQQAFVNKGVKIGVNNIINTRALLEHEVKTGDHCHISTNAVLNGQVQVADRVFIGSNSVLVNNVKIAAETVIGAGATVISSINEKGIYAGQPARRIQ